MSHSARTLYLAFTGFAAILLAVPSSYAQQEITIKEWNVPTPGSTPHDIVVDRNGVVWYTAIGANKIGRFDPSTEKFQEFDIPTPSSRPHGLVADENGNIWFTEQAASKIGKLDPATGEIEEFPTPTPSSGAHTPIMGDGVLWFTEQSASNIGRLDLSTGEIEEFPTPTPNSSPYGIILDSDGNPWYAALGAHRIGKVDAQTGEITEYPTPTANSGTRRIAIDSEGKLWFTEYNAGKIGSFNPATGEFQEYETESSSSGPYAIWVDIYDNVWFSMTGAHKTGRFDQNTGTMHEYDMPTPNTTSRFIYADSEGRVWFPNDVNNKIGVITLERKDSAAQPQDPANELIITEVELSSPDMEGKRTVWIEIHNPINQTFHATISIRPSGEEYPQYVADSVRFDSGEYIVLEIWDSSISEEYPNENVELILYTVGDEVDRTPPLTDTLRDSQTWQLNGTEWGFEEATPMRAIPEFGAIAGVVIAIGMIAAIFAARFMIRR